MKISQEEEFEDSLDEKERLREEMMESTERLHEDDSSSER